jgi:hypothetical protein
LDRILSGEALPVDRLCSLCSTGAAIWRCLECLGRPTFCTDCCREQHLIIPLHRIQRWTGDFFLPAWLRQVGVVVYLGHGGKPCPESRSGELEPVGHGGSDDNDEDEGKDKEEEYLYDFEDTPLKAGKLDENGNSMMVIVDKSGVHHLPVNWCECQGCPKRDMQLLDMGLFPASFQRFHSVFTFAVLDDFLLENLECKTSAYHYISKLARVTSPEFPHSTMVCPISL